MKRYMIVLGLILFLLFVGGAFAASTFNPEKGGNNTTGFCVFLTGASFFACTVAWSYLNSTKVPKRKQNSSMYSNTLPSAGEYTAGQAWALIQSREQILELIALKQYVEQILKGGWRFFSRVLKDGWRYIFSRVSSGIYHEKTGFQIRWDLPHRGQEYPHINIKGVDGAEELNHQPLDYTPNPKTALKAYSSTKGRKVLNKIVNEGKITSGDVDALNLAIKELSPWYIGLETVKKGLPISIAVSSAYNGYEVYTGHKDIPTAAVDVAEDAVSSATGLYVGGSVFASCMEGGLIGGFWGVLACGIAGFGAGIAADMGVRIGLEYAENSLSSTNIEDITNMCFVEMDEKRTISMDCEGRAPFPSLPQDIYGTIPPIDPEMEDTQRITASPNKTPVIGDNYE